MGAVGDRNKEGQDPPFVHIKPSYFEWRKVRLPADPEDLGPIATFCDTSDNKGEFCNLKGCELEIDETPVPKFALVPSKIATDALEEGQTP